MKACNQCGKCCKQYSDGGLSASADELAWWETFRPEIARYTRDGKIWMDPESGERLSVCPFLSEVVNDSTEDSQKPSSAPPRYTCQIYHDRPEDCRHYPVSISEMVRDECEMLEVRDLSDPEKAQRVLDRLMSDSRPALGSKP